MRGGRAALATAYLDKVRLGKGSSHLIYYEIHIFKLQFWLQPLVGPRPGGLRPPRGPGCEGAQGARQGQCQHPILSKPLVPFIGCLDPHLCCDGVEIPRPGEGRGLRGSSG